jgi:hypothetical protein
MRKAQLALPTIGLIAGTRVMLGVGLGILLAGKFNKGQRHVIGWTLFLVGVGATVPLAMKVLGQKEEVPGPPLAAEREPA